MEPALIKKISKSGVIARITGLVEFTEKGVTEVVGTVSMSRAWVVGEVMDPVEGHSLKVHAGSNYHYIPFRLITTFHTSDFGFWK